MSDPRIRTAARRGVVLSLLTIVVASLCLALNSGVAAASPSTMAGPGPAACVDEVGVLGSSTCTAVAAILDKDERLTSDEIAVLVIETTGDETIEHYATRTFNRWGIGKSDKDNGVLLVVALDDRAVRIEVGIGLERQLTTGATQEIIYGTMTPAFKQGEYRTGILAGLDAIRRQLDHTVTADNSLSAIPAGTGYRPTYSPRTTQRQMADTADGYRDTRDSGSGLPAGWIVLFVIIVLAGWAWSAYRRANGYDDGTDESPTGGYRRTTYRSSRSYRSSSSTSRRSSSGSSSRSSFGGGRSRGGGGSGSW